MEASPSEVLQTSALILEITNPYPLPVTNTIIERAFSTEPKYAGAGYESRNDILGVKIGRLKVTDPKSPIRFITTRVIGNFIPNNFQNPKAGSHPEFNIETEFEVPNHTYIGREKAVLFINELKKYEYESSLGYLPTGRRLEIATPEGKFYLSIGFPTPEEYINFLKGRNAQYREKLGTDLYAKDIDEIVNRHDQSSFKLAVASEHDGIVPGGSTLKSKDQVEKTVEAARNLAEVVGTVLAHQLTGKDIPKLQMQWLPPNLIF